MCSIKERDTTLPKRGNLFVLRKQNLCSLLLAFGAFNKPGRQSADSLEPEAGTESSALAAAEGHGASRWAKDDTKGSNLNEIISQRIIITISSRNDQVTKEVGRLGLILGLPQPVNI